jgi:ATP-binding cassette subfamily B protein
MQLGRKEATDEEIIEAIEIAQIKEFVNENEKGLDYQIDQAGKNVSGGQKQRLSIARALVKKPKIYIFDDSFSALDYKTDKLLRSNLKTKIKDAINVIVGQRIGTIMDANQIIVLDQGEIVGKGTHKELLTTCKAYQEIAYAQLSKEELANG